MAGPAGAAGQRSPGKLHVTIPRPLAFLALTVLCVTGTPGHVNAQSSVPQTERATRPPGAVLGLHAGSEVTDDSDHGFIGGRAAFPLVWRSLVQVSANWHLPGGDNFGEGTIALRVHPLPTELYLSVGVGARTGTDLVTVTLAWRRCGLPGSGSRSASGVCGRTWKCRP